MKATFEFEHRFSEFDMEEVLARARALGAGAPEPSLMAYSAYSMEGRPEVYARVRDYLHGPGKPARTVLTVKLTGGAFDEEYESAVEDGAQARRMLGALGLTEDYRIEKMRDVLEVPGLGELDFDTAPGLPPFLEVECHSAAKLTRLVRALGLGPPERFNIGDLYVRIYGAAPAPATSAGSLTFLDADSVRRRISGSVELRRFDTLLATQRRTAATLRQTTGEAHRRGRRAA